MEVDLVSVNDSCHSGEKHSGDSRKAPERVGCKASLQLEVEEDYSPPPSPGCILLDLCPTRNPYRTAVWRRPLKLTTRSIIQPSMKKKNDESIVLIDAFDEEEDDLEHLEMLWSLPPWSLWERMLFAGIMPFLGSCKRKCCRCIVLKSKEMCSCWIWSGLAGLIWASTLVTLTC